MEHVYHQAGRVTRRPVLYSFRRCPYAMRARMAIAASGVGVELREVILREKPPHMMSLSPKGTVPVLWLADGRVLDESRDVMDWALNQHDPFDWRARCDAALIDVFDTTFKHHLDRYKYATRYAGVDILAHRDACRQILAGLEDRLAFDCLASNDLTSNDQGGGWLGGDTAGLTDVAVLPFVRQYRTADPQWFDTQMGLHNALAWLHRFLDWPVFRAVMEKYPLWNEGDQPLSKPVIFAPRPIV